MACTNVRANVTLPVSFGARREVELSDSWGEVLECIRATEETIDVSAAMLIDESEMGCLILWLRLVRQRLCNCGHLCRSLPACFDE